MEIGFAVVWFVSRQGGMRGSDRLGVGGREDGRVARVWSWTSDSE